MPVSDQPSLHVRHDAFDVARLAAGDVPPADRLRIRSRVDGCPECRSLLDDLLAIAAASVLLPSPGRTVDFRLTEADASRLRGNAVARWLGRMAGPRFAFVQPLGTAVAALGVVGLLVATAPSFARTPSVPVELSGPTAESPAFRAEPSAAGGSLSAPAAVPAPTGGSSLADSAPATAGPAGVAGPATAAGLASTEPSPAVGPLGAAAPVTAPPRIAAAPVAAVPAAGAPTDSGLSARSKDAAASPATEEGPAAGPEALGMSAGAPDRPEWQPLLAGASVFLVFAGLGLLALRIGARRIRHA